MAISNLGSGNEKKKRTEPKGVGVSGEDSLTDRVNNTPLNGQVKGNEGNYLNKPPVEEYRGEEDANT